MPLRKARGDVYPSITHTKKYDAETNLALDALQRDQNIPIDQRCEGSCMYYANTGECGVFCPKYIGGDCPIAGEVEEKNGIA